MTTMITRVSIASGFRDLESALAGKLITAESDEYGQARKVQNIDFDRHPLAIVRAANTQDVSFAIRFARRHGLRVAVRSGGHSVAGHSMVDDAIVVDLSHMKGIEIDPATGVARVQPGVTSGQLAPVAAQHGLAISTGDTSSVGFGGLATGGGIGFMVRKHGLTIDHMLAAEVVTADGEIITASKDEHPELFWAIRGGGGNLGVVTEFTFQLKQVGTILGGDLLLPASREVIRGYLDYTVNAPDGLSTIAHVMHAPPAPFVPADMVGSLVLAIIVCWTGDLQEGEAAVAPLRSLATPVADTVRPMSYPDIYLSTEHQAAPHGAVLRTMFADELSDDTLDAFIRGIQWASSPYSVVHLRGLGGQMSRVSKDATAFAHRDRRYMMAIIAVWLDPNEDAAPHHAWAEDLWNQVRQEGIGAYVNFVGDEGEDRIRDAYPSETYERLARVKQAYDPANVFSLNQNIRPAAPIALWAD